ncbi:MAG: ActS/PrrB/RegB family redox-sensitive histidine kinase [Hyphomicrobiales bacterium]|uniref:ActS/PrrB/RegB family redox-sensitive histidine kinase n=1 Tax=Aestuariivirga sp. TaxID=2650926 RepID=UPI0035B4ED42
MLQDLVNARPASIGAEIGMLRLRTLVRLRWLAIVGQTGAVLGVHLVLGFPLPLGFCLAVIALSAWLNIFLSIRWRKSVRLQETHAGLLLVYDVLQLAVLLFLTGGLENPFSFLFLVPVTISATSLPNRWTLWLGLLAFACATFLAFRHFPLPWLPGERFELPDVYIGGMWAAIVCGVVFSAIYARRIADEARQMSAALSATEMVLAREQRLSALDGMAAAAAHELGTPLATIALVAKELKREMPLDEHAEDIDLLISQTARCREILARLANREAQTDEMYQRTAILAMIEDLVAPLRGPDAVIAVTSSADLDDKALGSEPVFRRNPAITYGLGNLLENAVDFAETRVEVDARWTPAQVSITVRDDGPGFHENVFDRLGDPFVTTRPGYGEDSGEPGRHEGMGLGFFIAKTLLERSGATVSLANRADPEHGAVVHVVWPRSLVDLGRA